MPYSKTTELEGLRVEVVKDLFVQIVRNNHVIELPLLSAAPTESARINENAKLHYVEALALAPELEQHGIDRRVYETVVQEVYCKHVEVDLTCVVRDASVVPAGLYPVTQSRNGLVTVCFIEGAKQTALVPAEIVTFVPKINLIPVIENGVVNAYEHYHADSGIGVPDHDGEHGHDCSH